jgi:hypothetical protein
MGASDRQEELDMKILIGAALVAVALAVAAPAAIDPATAASREISVSKAEAVKVTDFSARRHYRRYYGYRPYVRPYYAPYYRPYPYYYARPRYYRPYPYYAPAPFTFGFGFGPYW